MTNLKMFFINVILSAIVGALMQVIWALFAGFEYLEPKGLINMMITGMIVGTVSLFCIFQVILKFNTNLKKAVFINMLVMLVLLVGLYIQSGILGSNWNIDGKWLVIFLIAETAAVTLTILWYRQMAAYSRQLENKKASLKRKIN